jgi:hypothetical protein
VPEGYDIIGDIHGHGDQLHAFLRRLDYHLDHGVFAHPRRQAIFVGDLIDRGPQNRMVVDTVATMVAAGTAMCVMGNHEFNAWAFHYENSRFDWLRPRSNKNLVQHLAFLYEYMDPQRPAREQELQQAVDFFTSMPVYLDLGEIRVIHACWHPDYLRQITPQLNRDLSAPAELLIAGHKPGTTSFAQFDNLLKGHEIELPDGGSYEDAYGIVRRRMRTRWWLNEPTSYRHFALGPPRVLATLPDTPVSENDLVGYPGDAPPVFVGHYWQTGIPQLMAPNVACVDYSMGRGEKLVGYRWDGEQRLDEGKFISVDG